MKKEKIAVSAVEQIVSCTDLLDPVFDRNDKTPSWDGFIYAYKNNKQRKDEMYGRAPVQIKGTTLNIRTKTDILFRVNYADIQNYCEDGGALFFVVQIEDNRPKEIFIASLLPRVLNDLLQKHKGKKTFLLQLQPLPVYSKDVEDIVINFVENKKRQASARKDNWTLEEVAKTFNLEQPTIKYRFHNVYKNKDPFDYLLNHYTEMYVPVEVMKQEFPIGAAKLEYMRTTVKKTISIEGDIRYSSYDVRRDREGCTLVIGDFLKIANRGEKTLFSINVNGNLNTQIEQEKFLIDMFKAKSFQIGSEKIDIDIEEENKENLRIIKALQNRHDWHKDLMLALEKLNVDTPLSFEEWEERDAFFADQIIKAFVYNESVMMPETMNAMSLVKIGNIYIGIMIERTEENKCNLYNMFDNDRHYFLTFDDQRDATSIYVMLRKEHFSKMSNIDYNVVLQSIKDFHNESHFNAVNRMLLEMLLSFDEKTEERIIIAASDIAEWLYHEDKNDCNLLNWYQTLYRANNNDRRIDEDALKTICTDSKENALKAGALILLGDRKNAEILINNMEPAQREMFMGFPITNLL